MTLEDLLRRIRAEFPDLAFETARLANGDDNWVVILDDAWAVRFPRSPQQARWFPVEIAVLAALHGHTPVQVPHIERTAADGSFGAYRLVPGQPLTPAAFAALPQASMERLIEASVELLKAVHALPASVVILPDGTARTAAGAPAWAAREYRTDRRRLLVDAATDPVLLNRLDAFFTAYPNLSWPLTCVIHGDFTEDHMLVAADGDTLTGVIDFGDTVLGDPAYDLTIFWAAGDWAAQAAAGRLGGDDGLLQRSRYSFVRYSVGRLCEAHGGDEHRDADKIGQSLLRHLQALGF